VQVLLALPALEQQQGLEPALLEQEQQPEQV